MRHVLLPSACLYALVRADHLELWCESCEEDVAVLAKEDVLHDQPHDGHHRQPPVVELPRLVPHPLLGRHAAVRHGEVVNAVRPSGAHDVLVPPVGPQVVARQVHAAGGLPLVLLDQVHRHVLEETDEEEQLDDAWRGDLRDGLERVGAQLAAIEGVEDRLCHPPQDGEHRQAAMLELTLAQTGDLLRALVLGEAKGVEKSERR
mmetsp:Transcript_45548/g.113119  ORF Transcript_45548/g.113119 Transcript_45548/m.113119 type:complete len:204 (+) Transcript_45548:1047-1658(+)